MEIKTILILLLLGFSGIITYVYVLPHFEKTIPTNKIIPIIFDEPTSSIDIYNDLVSNKYSLSYAKNTGIPFNNYSEFMILAKGNPVNIYQSFVIYSDSYVDNISVTTYTEKGAFMYYKTFNYAGTLSEIDANNWGYSKSIPINRNLDIFFSR